MRSKKELKEAYKQMKFKIGVFQIRNIVSGKVLVEGSTNMDAKWNRHRAQLNFNSHPNKELQKDWKELGEENFLFEILAEIEQKDEETIDYEKEVQVLEEMYLEEIVPFGEKGYHRKK